MCCPRRLAMNNPGILRHGLPGLLLAACLALAGCDKDTPITPPTPQTAPAATETSAGGPAPASNESSTDQPRLESLASLGDQPLARRKLDIQTWQTAEGAKVLFVEAHELPMFDLRLTFAAGSSQDNGTPGL